MQNWTFLAIQFGNNTRNQPRQSPNCKGRGVTVVQLDNAFNRNGQVPMGAQV